MAPWPEPQGTEPKAPDKSSSENNDASGKDFSSMDEEIECNVSEAIELKSMSNSTEEKQEPPASDVSDLNDGELRALLDEAYNYKSPKDREGKSEIFKKFLEEAETAENEGGPETSLLFAEAPSARASGGKRRSGRREPPVSERQSRCGSLQNLSQCHVEPWPHAPSVSRRSRHGNHLRRGASTSSTCSSATSESVSTRQREGGSLPCSVNAVHDLRTLAGFCGGDDSLTVPSLDDLTSWHSSYSMPRLLAQQDKPAVVTTTQVTTEVEQQQQQSSTVATVAATVKKPSSPGYETATINKQEMKSELIARVEAVNSEKQKIRERAEEELCERDQDETAPNPKYRSSMEWSINNSKPATVDEAPDISYFRLHPTPDGTVLVPSSAGTNLELTEGNAVRSVLEANLNANRQDAQSKSVVARDGPARKQIYMTSSIQSSPHLYFKDEANATALLQVINTHANKVVVPSSGPKCDDNGNYVGGGADKQGDGSSSQKKKHKKEKGKKMMSHDVEGFKGNEDLDSLLMYIEGENSRGEAQGGKQAKQKRNNGHSSREVQQELSSGGRRSHRHSEEGESTSSNKRNKLKERSDVTDGRVKMKRANSLEEVSRTKLEDFADPTESSRSVGEGRTSQLSMDFEDDLDDIDPRLDEQNGNPSNYKTEFYHSRVNSGFKEDFYSVVEVSPQHTEDREKFQLVTKKQRRKKQRSRQDDRASRHSASGYQKQNYDEDDDSSILSGFGYRSYRSHHQNDRRKCKSTSSMPPSDQSGGESSDLDSVHSLPVSSTTKKPTIDKTSTSSGSTPQASYADIARMASVNPPPPPIQQTDIPVHNSNKTKSHDSNNKVNSSCTENWETEEWPQVCSNRTVSSVSSQTQQDMPKKDAMTSTFLDVTAVAGAIVTPLQVTATQSAASVASTSSSSSISPPSSTISSSNATTEPNTPPEEATRVNVLQDYYPSLEESVNSRRTNLLGDENVCDKRKTDDNLRSNNNGGEQLNKKSNNNNNNIIIDDIKQHNTEFNNSKEKYIINSKNVNSSASKINSNNIKVIENIPNGDHIELHQKSRSQVTKTNTASNNTVIYANLINNNPVSTQQPPSSNIIPSINPSLSSTNQQQQQTQQQQQNMPAVILLNEIQTSDSNSDISGLTFGFEVNDELLLSQNNIVDNSMVVEPEANNLETIIINSSPMPDPPPNQQQQHHIATNMVVVNTSSHKTKDFAAMYRPILSTDCSHDKQAGEIVNFVGKAWEHTLSEIGYTTQEHVKCAPVQYYKCNTDLKK